MLIEQIKKVIFFMVYQGVRINMVIIFGKEYDRVIKQWFPNGMDYTVENIIFLFEKEFNARQIDMEDIPKYIKECRDYPHYFQTIEDYTEDSISSSEKYLIFVSDAISDNNYREEEDKLFNLIVLSVEGDKVINYYSNAHGGNGDFMMLIADKFYKAGLGELSSEEVTSLNQAKFEILKIKKFNNELNYTLSNLIIILKEQFNAVEIELKDLEKYAREYSAFSDYYNCIEDYTEERIKSGQKYIVLISDDDNKEPIFNGSFRIYNVIFISYEADKILDIYPNLKQSSSFLKHVIEVFGNNKIKE